MISDLLRQYEKFGSVVEIRYADGMKIEGIITQFGTDSFVLIPKGYKKGEIAVSDLTGYAIEGIRSIKAIKVDKPESKEPENNEPPKTPA